MKVGILTLTYDNDNFGAHLQAWALTHAILKLNPSINSGVIPLIDHPNYHKEYIFLKKWLKLQLFYYQKNQDAFPAKSLHVMRENQLILI